MKRFFIFLLIFYSLIVEASPSNVLVVEIGGTIDQSTVEMLKESLQEAERRKSVAIILLLDTPGGRLQETFSIWDIISESRIPFIGYVYPRGAAAWSAGTFILLGTHIAAMAENTVIGSCQPVEVTIEGTKPINDTKTINALVAKLHERADIYNRNKSIVSRFVTENLNLNETLALKYGVIEFVSSTLEALLDSINGTTVTTSAGNITLFTKDALAIRYSPSFKIQFLRFISNPLLTSLLLTLGIFAIIFGISSPGYGAEVFGVIAVLLSLIGSGFAISELSILFLLVGALLLIIEIFVTPGFGVIGIGGTICLIIGSIFLIPSHPGWLISKHYMIDVMIVLLVIIALIAIFFAFLLFKVLQIRKKKTAVGTFIGEKAKTIDRISSDKPGYVRFKGEYWQAKSDKTIEPNTTVVIVGKEEATLIVEPQQKEGKH
jgi:membrane-bound serine protease (ClpP class)